MQSKTRRPRRILDRLGIAASTTCAIHCVGVALLAASPALGLSFLRDERLEIGLLVAALAIGLVSLAPSALRHRRREPLMLFAVGIALVVLGKASEGVMEAGSSAFGALCIASAHWTNLRKHDQCCPPEDAA